jgi:hypothetical protein
MSKFGINRAASGADALQPSRMTSGDDAEQARNERQEIFERIAGCDQHHDAEASLSEVALEL